MPKLPSETAERQSGWEIQNGIYEVELKEVQDKDKTGKLLEGPSGYYWRWYVTFPADANGGKHRGRVIDKVVSLGESSDGIRANVYAAFGIEDGDDTDVAIGRRALANVEIEPSAEYGDRPKIKTFYPLDSANRVTASDAPTTTKPKGKAKVEEEAANF